MESILIIDDDEVFCQVLARSLTHRKYTVWAATTPMQGMELARVHHPDWVVLDLHINKDTGLSLIKPLLEIKGDMRILMLTGYASLATAVRAVKMGAYNYLSKPATTDEVLQAFTSDSNKTVIENSKDESISLKRLEWEQIQFVLQKNDGNVSATARELGIHRRTLQRKLQKRPGKW